MSNMLHVWKKVQHDEGLREHNIKELLILMRSIFNMEVASHPIIK